mmetsp:Transcript_45322/g.73817  ORF Transcript_45322/g.73817 Transcript_45322/m.73817 type:complete len:137 (-) Transcript_45322:96-506(-)
MTPMLTMLHTGRAPHHPMPTLPQAEESETLTTIRTLSPVIGTPMTTPMQLENVNMMLHLMRLREGHTLQVTMPVHEGREVGPLRPIPIPVVPVLMNTLATDHIDHLQDEMGCRGCDLIGCNVKLHCFCFTLFLSYN